MDQHPVPRQITTFEFKLIGFMTLKQFLYLLVFFPIGFVFYKIIPIPFLNIAFAALTCLLGAAFAFVPINERPMDVWVKNFIRRLTSPTQYVFAKNNPPLYFLQDLYFVSDPHRVMSHIESREKLAAYLVSAQQRNMATSTPSTSSGGNAALQQGGTAALQQSNITTSQQSNAATTLTPSTSSGANVATSSPVVLANEVKQSSSNEIAASSYITTPRHDEAPSVNPPPTFETLAKRPFFIGIVKNNRKIPLPGVMIYVKDEANAVVRLLKTNPHGVFATYNTLNPGIYTFEIKDPKEGYYFDTMKLEVQSSNPNPFEFFSKELL